MPIVVPVERWGFDPEKIDTGFEDNHPAINLTTESILCSLDELMQRPEMEKLDKLLIKSEECMRGRPHDYITRKNIAKEHAPKYTESP